MMENVRGSALGAVFMGVLAMVLIYTVTVFMPKIAAFVDKLLGKTADSRQEKISDAHAEPSPARVEQDYKVHDIYEGEKNLDD